MQLMIITPAELVDTATLWVGTTRQASVNSTNDVSPASQPWGHP